MKASLLTASLLRPWIPPRHAATCTELSRVLGQFRFGEMLAGLQRPEVAHNGPAVAHGDLGAVGRHRTVAFADHGEQIAHGHSSQPLDMVGRRRRIAALDDLTLSRAQGIVADHAVDHETIVSVLEDLFGHRKRESVDELVVLGLGEFRGLRRAGLRLDDGRAWPCPAAPSWSPVRLPVNKATSVCK